MFLIFFTGVEASSGIAPPSGSFLLRLISSVSHICNTVKMTNRIMLFQSLNKNIHLYKKTDFSSLVFHGNRI